MEVSQRIAVTGMLASQRQLDVVSNNLANVNSTGFKRAVAHTTDVGYQAGLTAPVGPGGIDVRLVGIGEGTQLADVTHEFMPGCAQADWQSARRGAPGRRLLPGQPARRHDRLHPRRLVRARCRRPAGHQRRPPVQSDTGGRLLVPADRSAFASTIPASWWRPMPPGPSRSIGRLGLSQFPNNSGLQASGQNLWTPNGDLGRRHRGGLRARRTRRWSSPARWKARTSTWPTNSRA